MHWVLQKNMFAEEGYDRLLRAMARCDVKYSEHKVVPFVGDISPEPVITPGDNVVVVGSYSMADHATKMGWVPGSFKNDNLDFEVQIQYWGNQMLNHDAVVTTLGEVEFQEKPFFIRPTLDTKSFSGMVMDWGEFTEWQESIRTMTEDEQTYATVDLNTKVMVCKKRKIHREFRLWVVDGIVVTASMYRDGAMVRYDDRVDEAITNHGTAVAAVWSPARAYVLDLCDTPDGIKIVEAGCINAAGFYAADMQLLLMAIENMNGFEFQTKDK